MSLTIYLLIQRLSNVRPVSAKIHHWKFRCLMNQFLVIFFHISWHFNRNNTRAARIECQCISLFNWGDFSLVNHGSHRVYDIGNLKKDTIFIVISPLCSLFSINLHRYFICDVLMVHQDYCETNYYLQFHQLEREWMVSHSLVLPNRGEPKHPH